MLRPEKWILMMCLLLCTVGMCFAQTTGSGESSVGMGSQEADARPVTRATLYGAGFTHLQDTYLSPEEYRGVEFRISRESTRQTRLMSGHVYRQTYFQTNLGYTGNRADNNKTATALANWNYALHYRLPMTRNFTWLVGPLADLAGGFTYNMRNGNNPASLRASASLDASVAAVWNLTLKGKPLGLRWQANVPLVGVAFMPHYGESYYEIFSLGHHSGTVKATTPFSAPSARQMLTADYPIGRVRLRVAYVFDAQQFHLNHIKTHVFSHVLMIGFVKKFLPL